LRLAAAVGTHAELRKTCVIVDRIAALGVLGAQRIELAALGR
jgi:hypothetical protein